MDEKFSYVIAAPSWPQLSVYMVHNSEVHYGNKTDAERMLDYVRSSIADQTNRSSHCPKPENYTIYKLVPLN